MKILQINTVYGLGSTGKIVKDIHDRCIEYNIECICGYRNSLQNKNSFPDSMIISGNVDSRIHGFLARYTMFKGCFSYFKTKRFIKKVKAYNPDLIHLHNLHGSYINIGILMRYIKKNNKPVVFTLHDCWAFSAICTHFTIAKCDRWCLGCGKCPQRKKISSSPIDLTTKVWKLKRKWFCNVSNMTIVPPSKWLAGLVRQSFLKNYPIKTIYNGIDLDVFKPTASNFRDENGLNEKKIVLAVAFGWGYEKGFDVVIEIAERLPPDYSVVIVGVDEATEKKVPDSMIAIRRTENQEDLAKVYTAADVLINPTREEVLGLVNIEALACGTPVITFDSGGSPECVDDSCGVVVDKDDIDSMEREIIRICMDYPYSVKDCIARAKCFDKNKKLEEYIDLYKRMTE